MKTAEYLYVGGYYDACLFFCHLAIEKILKALVTIEIHDAPPFIHDLERLARLADITITDAQKDALIEITGFNIAGRYKEEKYQFYKKCTKPFTTKKLALSHEICVWLQKEFQKRYPKK